MSAVGVGLGVLINSLRNPSSAGPAAITGDDLAATLADIAVGFEVVRATFDAADAASLAAITAATDAATQVEELGNDIKQITEHTYNIVIPHSLSWLAGWVVTTLVDPLRKLIDALDKRVAALVSWRTTIDQWRAKYVDPNLNAWITWHRFWDTWPSQVVSRWHGYFDKPAEFAAWAAPPLVGPLVSYLAAPEHHQSRDTLTAIIVKAWSEEPEVVWTAVQEWLLAGR